MAARQLAEKILQVQYVAIICYCGYIHFEAQVADWRLGIRNGVASHRVELSSQSSTKRHRYGIRIICLRKGSCKLVCELLKDSIRSVNALRSTTFARK